MKQYTVLYHADCPDGFGAAWSAWRYFGLEAEYKPVDHRSEPPWDLVDGKDVWVVDFCYPRDVLKQMHARAADLRVLDHHVTAMKGCGDLPFCTFDMNRSGAGLTWDVLHRTKRPWFIDYIEDRDLWRWAQPESQAVCDGLEQVPKTFEAYDAMYEHLMPTQEQVTRDGRTIQQFKQTQMDRLKRKVRVVTFAGHEDVPVLNSSLLQSELGHQLLQWYSDAPFSVVYSRDPRGGYRCSLRSEDGRADVSVIAKQLGGGGHRNASGAHLDSEP